MKKKKAPQHQPKDFSEKEMKNNYQNQLPHKDTNYSWFFDLIVIALIMVLTFLMHTL